MADTNAYRPQRPRTSSMLSWGSHKSKDSQPKIDLTETERDKAQRRIKGKADPSVAIRELQPSAQAFEKSTIASLRSMQFRDANGEVITDPDRSNPTRPRFERPLDTIRSFEAAIDSSYSSRYPTANIDLQSRRNSMFSGYAPQSRNPTKTFSTYYDRQPDSRPESIYEQQQANGYGNYSGGAQPNAWNGARRMPHGRMTSEPAFNSHAQSRQHAYQNSYDTTTASSAGTYQTDQGTVSTNPSSFNGSNGDAGYTHPHMKPQPPVPQDTYGIEFGGQQEDEYATQLNNSAYYQQSSNNHATNNLPARGSSYGNTGDAASPPPPPPHSNSTRKTLRKPVGGSGGGEARPAPASNGYNSYDGYSANNGYNGYNGQSNGYNGHNGYNGYDAESPSERPKNEKRKSWLSRRFSRQT